MDHDPSDDRFWERVAAEPWIPAANHDGSPSGDLIKFGPFPNDDTDATVTDARGSISPLGGCRQRTGRGLSLTRRILSTCLLLRTGSRVRYGGGGLVWERRACVTVHWRIARGSGRNDHTPCSDMKSQVLGERVASRKPCAARGLARSSTQYLLCDEEESWRAESQARRLLVTRRAALLHHWGERAVSGPRILGVLSG